MAEKAAIPAGWEEVQAGIPAGWEEITGDEFIALSDPKKVAGLQKYAEALSSTPAWGIGEHAGAAQIPEEDRELFKELVKRQYSVDQTYKNAGYGARLASSIVGGAVDFGMPLAKMIGAVPGLDPDQERFKRELLGIREGIDPTIRPDTNVIGRGIQQAGRMGVPMMMSIGAGKALGGGAASAGAGSLGIGAATALGTSGSFLPQIADSTYSDLIAEGVDPDRARTITVVAAPIEAAIESILPDPLSPYATAFKGTVRQVAGNIIRQATKNFTKELVEEGLQGAVHETALEVGRRMDESIPDKGVVNIFMQGVESMKDAALPLALMMAPGASAGAVMTAQESAARKERLETLREIRSSNGSKIKGRAAEVGITGTRSEVRKQLDAEITSLEKEIERAEAIRSDEGEVRQEEGGQDVRRPREEQVRPEPAGEVAQAQEVPNVADQQFDQFYEEQAGRDEEIPTEDLVRQREALTFEEKPKRTGRKPAEDTEPVIRTKETPELDLARQAARGEAAERPEGISEARWNAMVSQQAKSMGLKPPKRPQEAAVVEPEQIPTVQPEVAQEAAQTPELPAKSVGRKKKEETVTLPTRDPDSPGSTTTYTLVDGKPVSAVSVDAQGNKTESTSEEEAFSWYDADKRFAKTAAGKKAAKELQEFGKDVSGTMGISPAVPIGGPRAGKSVRHFFQRFFTSRGELPQEVYNSKVKREGQVAKEMNELRYTSADFRRGIKKALGGKELTQADIESMNAVLRAEADPSTVPVEVRAPLQAMRDHIDSLSRRLIEEGVAQGELLGIIDENMGVYTTRSYRVFDDAKWRDKVPPAVRNRAVAAIRSLNPDKSDAEVAGILESLLFRGAADTPAALLKGSKLGSKDLSTFMRRKEIPPWLRDLWGEYKDAGVNYARSVFKMSNLLASHQFLGEVREAGLGKWLRTEEEGPIVNEHGEVITKIAADGSSVMEPLNGLYTTPEIKKAFERFDSPGSQPEWLRVLMSMNYAVKYGKTVGSMMTHIRNLISNAGFAVGNGHWRLDKANKAVWTTATGTFQLSKPEFRDYYSRLAELGIVGEDVRAGELKDALRDASQADIDEFLYNRDARHAKKIVNAGRSSVRVLNDLYQAEDSVWKVYAFENEKARYAKAHPEWSQQQLEERAAEIVRNTYPTYSKIPEGIKTLRRFPLAGTFVSFPSEVVRTTFHTLKLGIEEMQAQETRSIGAQRLAGTAVGIGALSMLSRAMMAMFGIGDDEDDDLRWFVPPWQENSRFIYTGKPKDGTYSFIDMGYSDPHAYITDSAVAFMRGEDWKDSIGKSLTEFLRPFASEDILAKALMDVRSNEDNSVYNPKDEAGEQAKDIVSYLWTKALEPGTLSSLRRIRTAAEGTDPSKSLTTEVMALTTGQRLQKVDVEHSLGFRVRDFAKSLTDIQGIARKTATSRGTASGEMVATDVARMERLRLAAFSEMQRIVGAARRLGVSEKTIKTMLYDELPDKVAEEIMTGDYSPYEMTPQTVEQMMEANPQEFRERFAAWHGDDLPQAVNDFAMKKLGNLPTKMPTDPDKAEEARAKILETKKQLDALGVNRKQAIDALGKYYINRYGKITPSYSKRIRVISEMYR